MEESCFNRHRFLYLVYEWLQVCQVEPTSLNLKEAPLLGEQTRTTRR